MTRSKPVREDCKVVISSGKKSPAETAPEGSNTAMLTKNLQIFKLPPLDLNDPDAVDLRITKYFEICRDTDSKPTLSGLAMALGLDRNTLWTIKANRTDLHENKWQYWNPKSVEHIRRTYDILEMMWEDYMLNGKINPASGIFIGKNQFDYRDVVDSRVTVDNSRTEVDVESIRKRYLIDEKKDS